MQKTVLIFTKGLEGRGAITLDLEREGFDIIRVAEEAQLLESLEETVIHVALIRYEEETQQDYNRILARIAERSPSSFTVLVVTGRPSKPYPVLKLLRRNKASLRPLASECFLPSHEHDAELAIIVRSIFDNQIQVKHELGIEFDLGEKPKDLFDRYAKRLREDQELPQELRNIGTDLVLSEFENVLGRIFFGHNGVRSVRISPLREIAYSGSSDTLTFRVTPIVEGEYETRSVILKFGPAELKIGPEIRNFERYVQWYARLSHSVHKLGHASWNHMAGIIYNFVADRRLDRAGKQEIVEFSTFVREKASGKSCDIIERMYE